MMQMITLPPLGRKYSIIVINKLGTLVSTLLQNTAT